MGCFSRQATSPHRKAATNTIAISRKIRKWSTMVCSENSAEAKKCSIQLAAPTCATASICSNLGGKTMASAELSFAWASGDYLLRDLAANLQYTHGLTSTT